MAEAVTPLVAPTLANASVLELKLTVTDRELPALTLTPPHPLVMLASAIVADPSTNPTALRSRKNAITIG